MAIRKVYTIALRFLGDGASTTYAVVLNTDTVELVNSALPGSARSSQFSKHVYAAATPLSPVPTTCLSGTTLNGVSFTGAIVSNTLTFTFTSTPPNGVYDSLVATLLA